MISKNFESVFVQLSLDAPKQVKTAVEKIGGQKGLFQEVKSSFLEVISLKESCISNTFTKLSQIHFLVKCRKIFELTDIKDDKSEKLFKV